MDKKAIFLTVGAGLGLISVSLGLIPRQETGTTEVIGKNDPAVDVEAIQDAVDNYEQVILRETFDFGDQGSVLISKSVELVGAVEMGPDSARTWKTTIRGGHEPIRIENPTGGKVTIKQLELDQPIGTAILYLEGQDLEVDGVRIVNVVPGHILREFPLDRAPGGEPITGRFGISAYDWDGTNERAGGKITGQIEIHDCVLDLSAPLARYSRVIVTVGGEADVTISDNEITALGAGNNLGIEVFLGNRTITVEHNHVAALSALIVVLGNYEPVHIRENTGEVLEEDSRSLAAVWVASFSEDAGQISDNTFLLNNAAVGFLTGFDGQNPTVTGPIQIPYRNGRISNNVLAGTIHREQDGVHGGVIFFFDSHDNVAFGNDFSQLLFADDGTRPPSYYLSPATSGNSMALLDADELAQDEGTGNEIMRY